jgi:peptidoglycan DL-endopeptidase CwlO
VSIDALVKHVGQVLNRAHALFGQSDPGGGLAAGRSGATLAGAAELVRHSHHRMGGLSGALRATYTTFATDAGPGLGEGL